MNIGEQIKRARKEAGLTQEQLGLACGWSDGNPQGRIGNYERNIREPSAAGLVAIAKALKKPIMYFYAEPGTSDLISEASGSHLTSTATGNSKDIEILKTIITEVEKVAEEEGEYLTPEERARAICAILRTSLTRNEPANNKAMVMAAIQAARL